MLTIKFYPESDKPEFVKGAEEYQRLWDEDGKRIVQAMEEVSGLKFVEKEINAIVFDGISYSYPLRLKFPHTSIRAIFSHEFLHRLLIGNDVGLHNPKESHMQLDLILFEIWERLYGLDFAEESIKLESTYHSPLYKEAWDWALAIPKEKRLETFRRSLIEAKI